MSFVISGPLHKLSSRPEIPFRPSADKENPPHFQVTRPDASWVREADACLSSAPRDLVQACVFCPTADITALTSTSFSRNTLETWLDFPALSSSEFHPEVLGQRSRAFE